MVDRDEVGDGDAVVYGGVLCGRRSVVRVQLLLPTGAGGVAGPCAGSQVLTTSENTSFTRQLHSCEPATACADAAALS